MLNERKGRRGRLILKQNMKEESNHKFVVFIISIYYSFIFIFCLPGVDGCGGQSEESTSDLSNCEVDSLSRRIVILAAKELQP